MTQLDQQVGFVTKIRDSLAAFTGGKMGIAHLFDGYNTASLEAFITRLINGSKAAFTN
jgi:hypothetical protein